jgi:hypothetical protein
MDQLRRELKGGKRTRVPGCPGKPVCFAVELSTGYTGNMFEAKKIIIGSIRESLSIHCASWVPAVAKNFHRFAAVLTALTAILALVIYYALACRMSAFLRFTCRH